MRNTLVPVPFEYVVSGFSRTSSAERPYRV
jgi:hypothetical protein